MIVVDIESTGVNSTKHSLVSIGAIDFSNPNREFYDECKIWNGASIMDEAMEINGFSEKEVQDENKRSEGEIVKAFLSWVGESEEHTIAGHNVHFDLSFIQEACRRAGIDFTLAHRLIDLHSISYFHMFRNKGEVPRKKRRSALNSDKVMEYVGIPEEPKPHIAINGARWEAEAFSRLFFDKYLFDEFKGYPIPWLN